MRRARRSQPALAMLAFAVALLVAVLVSRAAGRTALSTAVLVLAAGVVVGPGILGWVHLERGTTDVHDLAEAALVAVLFVEGLELDVAQLKQNLSAPVRALGVAMPLTIALVMLLARLVLALSWAEAFVVAAALAPTDPVFAASLTGEEAVPERPRRLLTVESGFNDALALPVLLVALAVAGGPPTSVWTIARQIGLGLVVGIAIPWLYARIEQLPVFGSSELYAPIRAVALGLVVYEIAKALHANDFVAMFAAGTMLGVADESAAESAHETASVITELLKLGATFAFGVLLTPELLVRNGVLAWVFAAACLAVARPFALAASFVRSDLSATEIAVAGWFGPRGFASIIFALVVLGSNVPRAYDLFDIIAVTTALSIVVHSSTDTLVARAYRRRARAPAAA